MTNGEKLKEIFPCIELYEKSHDAIQINSNSVWWNAEYKESTTKNDLGVDCIDRVELLKAIDTWDKFGYTETGCFVREPKNDYVPYVHYDDMVNCVKGMPSVTPQEPVFNDVLDKIRAEIKHHSEHFINDDGDDCLAVYEDDVFEIIDKYRGGVIKCRL